eukprot:UN21799
MLSQLDDGIHRHRGLSQSDIDRLPCYCIPEKKLESVDISSKSDSIETNSTENCNNNIKLQISDNESKTSPKSNDFVNSNAHIASSVSKITSSKEQNDLKQPLP